MCGTPKGEGRIDSNSNNYVTSTTAPAVNSLELSETRGDSSRKVKVRMSDALGISLGDSAIASMFTGQALGSFPPHTPTQSQILSNHPQQLSLIEGSVSDDKTGVTLDITAHSKNEETGSANRFKGIFRDSNGQVILTESRLKAANKLDAARRLTYLFLLYGADRNQDEINRAELTKVLKQADLDDGNTRTWIKGSSDLITEANMVGLRQSGIEKAEQILKEVLDSSIEDKWSLDKNSVSRRSKANTVKTEASSEPVSIKKHKANKTPRDVEDWISKWKPVSAKFSFHDSLKSSSVLQKGKFGLWAISKAIQNPDVVVSRGKLQKFLHLGLGFKVDERNLGRELQNIEGKGELIKVKGGFKLLSTGATSIEESLASKPLEPLESDLDLWQDNEEA